MRDKRTAQKGRSALELVDEAVHLLRLAPFSTLALYYVGSLPFVLGLLYFWADMSRSALAEERCAPAALGVSVLFLWMKSWQALFAKQLLAQVSGESAPPWSFRTALQVAMLQTVLQPSSLFVLPLALLITLPFGWVYAFYQNATVHSCDVQGDPRELFRKALRQAELWPNQNHLLLLLLSGFGLFVFLNVALGAMAVPQLLKILTGTELAFAKSWANVFNTTFLAAVTAGTYLCLDPLVKAVYVLRCFYGDSLRSGADLKAELRSCLAQSKAAATGLGVLLLVSTVAWPTGTVAAQDALPMNSWLETDSWNCRFSIANFQFAVACDKTRRFSGSMREGFRGGLSTKLWTSRQVLDCASPLAPFRRCRKRQRAAAVQDAGAPNPGPWFRCMHQSGSGLFLNRCNWSVNGLAGSSVTPIASLRVEPTSSGQPTFLRPRQAHSAVFGAIDSGSSSQSQTARRPSPESSTSRSRISSAELNRSIEQVINQREYVWRSPRQNKAAGADRPKGWLASFVEGVVLTVKNWARTLKQYIEDFLEWLAKKLSRWLGGPRGVDRPGADWLTISRWLLFALLAGVASVLAIAVLRMWRRRRRPVEVEAKAVGAIPDLADENIVADQLPEDDWLKLARELADQGDLRSAVRALFLASLAHLAERELITLARFKSNREYERELRRHARALPELQTAFARNVTIYDRVWYGLHEVSQELVDQFTSDWERIKGC